MNNFDEELNSALALINSENYVEAKAVLEKLLNQDNNNTELLKNIGLCEVNLDNPIDAIKAFKKVVELDSDDAVSLFYLANCYNRTGQKEFAIDNLKKVIELRPDYNEAYKTLAMIYIEFCWYDKAENLAKTAIQNPKMKDDYSFYYILSTVALIQKHNITALNYLETAHKLNPEHIQIANSLAVTYMNLNRYERVLPILNSIYEFDKENTLTLYNFGVYYQSVHKYDTALDYFKKVYEKEPTSTMLSTLANCALKANEIELAITLYKNLSSAYPNNVLYRLSYIEALEANEDYDIALDNINILLQSDDKNVAYIKKQGTYLRKLARYEQSIEIFNSLIKRGKIDVEVYYNLAFDYVLMLDYDNAKEMFKKCIELEPNNPYAHKDLGVLYLKMNFYDWAVDEMQTAIELEGDVAEFHYSLGVAQMMLSRLDEAKKCFENALKYETDYPDALAYYGYIFLLEKNYDEALKYLQKALTVDPNNFLAKNHMAKYYFGLEKYDTAKELLIDTLDITHDDETLNMLGICYMNTNKFEEARNIFQKLLPKYSKNHILYTNIAKCEFELKNYDKALEYVRSALLIFDDYDEALELLEEIKSHEH